MVTVTFEYDEQDRRWQAEVQGAEDEEDARNAFSAVVLSCQLLPERLLDMTGVEKKTVAGKDYYTITPVIVGPVSI